MSSYDTTPADSPGPAVRVAVAVDPPGCGCTECLTGEFVPLEQADPAQIERLLTGMLGNNTGLRFAVTPGGDTRNVHVVALFAEDGTPVTGNAPREPEWYRVEAGWDLNVGFLAEARLDPGRPATAALRERAAWPRPDVAGEADLARARTDPLGTVTEPGGCACRGRAEGRHDFICEHVLRSAFGSVGDAPEDVKQILRARSRIVTARVIDGGRGGLD
jgi:hypothetical protein